MDAGAFGAGKAGTSFNPVEFIQRPQVLLRLANIVSHSLNNNLYPSTTASPYVFARTVGPVRWPSLLPRTLLFLSFPILLPMCFVLISHVHLLFPPALLHHCLWFNHIQGLHPGWK